ncbi:helix-turn-helix domain-containing protein [Pyruvatibacter sp.]|uniref:winged helix-turn-helix transcriptional regulator n=1 Tax=Pyruvatibacter sp. TaxID=1981328 RepID=UPI003263F9B2
MPHDSSSCRSNCPINFVLETFGDKWTLLIVRDLMFKDKSSYREFLNSDEGIATNILADRLKRLEQHGIIFKEADPDNRSRVIYSLTDRGKDLMPVMLEITAWSAKHDRHTNTPPSFLEEYPARKKSMMARFLAKLS